MFIEIYEHWTTRQQMSSTQIGSRAGAAVTTTTKTTTKLTTKVLTTSRSVRRRSSVKKPINLHKIICSGSLTAATTRFSGASSELHRDTHAHIRALLNVPCHIAKFIAVAPQVFAAYFSAAQVAFAKTIFNMHPNVARSINLHLLPART